jgi:adenine/guanine phosphoribosyltransferase-like PRPP-binding protein
VIGTMGRTIVVGDIHGCALEFDDLLRSLGFAQGVDRVVLVGDLVARGPDSAGVVELARSCGAGRCAATTTRRC